MTLQILFDRMMVLDNQLDLLAGGDDVTRGLVIVNLVQDWWELVAAEYAEFMGTDSTFTTTLNTEKTTWPTGLLRLDGEPWLLDSNSRPIRAITQIQGVGAHVAGAAWPYSELSASVAEGSGAPREYWANGPGGNFYWTPIPDAVYTIRGYGLWAKSDYTTAANTFAYPDSVAAAVLPQAVKLFRIGLDRDLEGVQAAAGDLFRPTIKGLRGFNRNRAPSRQYYDVHDT